MSGCPSPSVLSTLDEFLRERGLKSSQTDTWSVFSFTDLFGPELAKYIKIVKATLPEDLCVVVLDDDFTTFHVGPCKEWLLTRAVATYPIFNTARVMGHRGAVQVWIDDFPRGPGLSFSGRERSRFLPDPYFVMTKGYEDLREALVPPWQGRKDDFFWRGYYAGFPEVPGLWYTVPRIAMCLRVKDNPLFDVGLTGGPCPLPAFMQQHDILRYAVPIEEFANHRYCVDIDGYSVSWKGLFTKLLFGCTVVKVGSEYRQWYFDKLVPWVHYVPVNFVDELPGMAQMMRDNEGDCERIAANARDLALSITMESAIFDGVNAIAAELAEARGD